MAWLRQVMEWLREMKDPQEFMETLKIDLFEDEVFVFTPRGDVKTLPAGATPIDFAFSVHTDIGMHTVGARVNGKMVPLDYRLQNGEIRRIVDVKKRPPVARLAERRQDVQGAQQNSRLLQRNAPRGEPAAGQKRRWSGKLKRLGWIRRRCSGPSACMR